MRGGEKDFQTFRLGTAGLRPQTRAQGGVAPLMRNVFACVPAAFLLIGIPFQIAAYQSRIDSHLPFGVVSVTKILMSLGMAACTVVE